MKIRKQKQLRRRKVVLGMFSAIILLFVSYSYAIASTTFSISDMKSKNHEIASLQTDIAELELEYISVLDRVSIEDAEEYELHELTKVGYTSLEKNTFMAYNF